MYIRQPPVGPQVANVTVYVCFTGHRSSVLFSSKDNSLLPTRYLLPLLLQALGTCLIATGKAPVHQSITHFGWIHLAMALRSGSLTSHKTMLRQVEAPLSTFWGTLATPGLPKWYQQHPVGAPADSRPSRYTQTASKIEPVSITQQR